MFDLADLRAAVARHGVVARVVIAAHDGSSPREVGAAMLVWADGQSGTIGGGALEHEATLTARQMLATQGPARLDHQALGPKLGQCCGGRVSVLTELFTETTLPRPEAGVLARSVDGRPMPLAVKRLLDRARGQGQMPAPALVQGWMVEPLAHAQRVVWMWGAGHVGRAIVDVISPLPGVAVTWVDIAQDRFPADLPAGVTPLWAADPAGLVTHAPAVAEHLILTFSHALDLELCHRLLGQPTAFIGLIGSATKWARFRSRLAGLGHDSAALCRITCPIGNPALGKHPQAIAIGVAADFLTQGAVRPPLAQTL